MAVNFKLTNNNMRILDFSYFLYNFILVVKFIEVVPKKFIKFVLLNNTPQKRRFFRERLGIFHKTLKILANKNKWIWLHANSIGEVNASMPLINLIKSKYGDEWRILLTTTNFSADKRALQLNIVDAISFFPYDIPLIIRRFLKIFNPHCIIIVECDVWPNFIKICKSKKISVLVISGMFTNGYSRSLGLRHLYDYTFRLSKDVFEKIDYFFMQTEEDARMLSYIIPEHKNIRVTGNLKFSCTNRKSISEEKQYYKKLFNIKEINPVFVAGNIHKVEDEMVINAFKIVKKFSLNAIMILAPRFMQDVSSMEFILRKKGFSYVKRTDLDRQERVGADVILLDTMGELTNIYSIAGVSFVGGSLVYLGDMFGGHNILEPAAVGVPVVFGCYMHNFQSMADLFCKREAGIQVKDSQELADWVVKFIANPDESKKYTSNAIKILEENRDVLEKTFLCIDEKLKQLQYS